MANKEYNKKLFDWLTKQLAITPKNFSYYLEALTHKSYSNENGLNYSYQRLEYLGDAVINMLVAQYLYFKYPHKDEGFLTISRQQIVQSKTEIAAAKKINLQNYLLLGHGFANSNDHDKILEDCFEALIGAIYLDLGIKFAKKVLLASLLSIKKEKINEWTFDYKTFIQDKLVKFNNKKIMYHTKQIDKNHFESILSFNKIIYGKGQGQNKKQAEKEAAKNAYNKLVTKEGKN